MNASTVRITQVAPEDLKAARYNPRTSSPEAFEQLKTSIRKFGVVDPLIVNGAPGRRNIVIGGHLRLRAMRELGYTIVPVVYVQIPEERNERELNIRLNKNTGEWDLELLAKFDEGLLRDVGFSPDELDGIFSTDTPVPPDVDEVPARPARPQTRLGDRYRLGEHVLVCGDALQRTSYDRLLEGVRPEMVFTDPPYNVQYGENKKNPNWRHHKTKIIGDSQTADQWQAFNAAWLAHVKAVYAGGDIYVWGASGPEGWRQRLQMVELGFHWSTTIIWRKQHFVLAPKKYQPVYEEAFYGHLAETSFDSSIQPADPEIATQTCDPCFYGWFDKSSFKGRRNLVDVWDIPRPMKSKEHPTMKPIALCRTGILNSSRRGGGAVLDPFGGSGSTLVAAEITGRRCFMLELDPGYCDVIINRWEKLTGKTAERTARAKR